MEKQGKEVPVADAASLWAVSVFAEGNGGAGINEITQMVTGY